MWRHLTNVLLNRMVMMMANNVEVLVSITCDKWTDELPDAESICKKAALATIEVKPMPDVLESLQRYIPEQPLKKNITQEISILLTDDTFIAGLNRDYRKKDYATNVLSFSNLGEGVISPALPEEKTLIYGDVVVAFETVKKEADSEDKTLEDHLSHMIVHGVLHLLGYNHEEDLEAEKMEAIEVQMLGSLGFDNPHTLAHGN